MPRQTVSFILLCEGTSDQGLVDQLATLLIRAGADEAVGIPNTRKGTVRERLQQLANEDPHVDLVFVHRDADAPNRDSRLQEISQAATVLDATTTVCVPVIPIQETEAWLLLDEGSIRAVVGKPSGTRPLGLPKLSNIERTSNPKELLAAALAVASEKSGRRLTEERAAFDHRRALLLQRLDVDGPIRQLSGWQHLEADIAGIACQLHWTP